MILSLIILLLIAVIAYFHWVQGLFSATLSAVIAVVSAVVAVSYHETLVEMLLKGKMADSANGMMLCVLFGGLYIILRMIFDKAVPGNLRFPSTVDAVGGGVMGVIVGMFATGIFALAAQSLPFGPTIAGYSRYTVKSEQGVLIPTDRQQLDSTVYDEVAEDVAHPGQFDVAAEKSLLIPVDDMVLSVVQRLSNGGSMAGSQTLSSIHPNYPQELFGTRVGIQVGAKHTALNLAAQSGAKLGGIYSISTFPAADPEYASLRPGRKVPPTIKPTASQLLLVARILVDINSSDDADKLFRFSTASIRLVANGKNYFPLGTVDNASTLLVQKPDDFLFLDTKAESGVDAAFLVDKSDVLSGGKSAGENFANGVFLEVKRLAKIDLTGKALDTNYTASPAINVMRKKLAMEKIKIAAAPPAVVDSAAPAVRPKRGKSVARTPAADAPPTATVTPASAQVSAQIVVKIGVTTIEVNAQNLAVAGGTVSLRDSKLAIVSIDPTETLDKLQTGDTPLNELYVPDGKKLVQLKGTWPSNIAALPRLLDASNTEIGPSGFYGIANSGGKPGLFMRYSAEQTIDTLVDPSRTPAVITFLFVVPDGTQIKQVSAAGQLMPLELTAQ